MVMLMTMRYCIKHAHAFSSAHEESLGASLVGVRPKTREMNTAERFSLGASCIDALSLRLAAATSQLGELCHGDHAASYEAGPGLATENSK